MPKYSADRPKTARLPLDLMLQASIALLMGLLVWTIYRSVHEVVIVKGDTAPSFHVTASNGREITPASFGGKLLILNFWATWCPPCVEETPSLNALAERFKGQGLVVLGVNIDKDDKAYQRFMKRFDVKFLTARDPDQNINASYGTYQIPETYIIDANGKVIDKVISNTDWMDEKMVGYVQSFL